MFFHLDVFFFSQRGTQCRLRAESETRATTENFPVTGSNRHGLIHVNIRPMYARACDIRYTQVPLSTLNPHSTYPETPTWNLIYRDLQLKVVLL